MNALSRCWSVFWGSCLLSLVSLTLTANAAAAPPPAQQPQGEQAEAPAPPERSQDPNAFHVFWRDGLRAETNDGRFQIRLGGRLQTDFNWPLERRPFNDLLGQLESGSEVRRGRLFVSGYLWESVEFKFQVDFAGGKTSAKDMYMGVRGWPVTARFGHLKEPFSIEALISSRFTTFMERSLLTMFAPERNAGLVVSKNFNSDRSTWALGVFRDTDGFVASKGDNYNFTGRVTHTLVQSDDSRRLLHLGVALHHKEIDGNLSLSERPGDHNQPKVLRASIPAASANYLGLETAANIGSFGLQAEYVSAWVKSQERGDPHLWGYYVQGSFFLTGETRPYSHGHFGRLRPKQNFPDGSGALQLAIRYSRVDLSEAGGGTAGVLWNLTTGLNWYWNPNVRFMFNHEYAQLPQLHGSAFSGVHMRAMFDF